MEYLDELIKKQIVSKDLLNQAKKIAEEKYSGDIESALYELGIPEDVVRDEKSELAGIPTKEVITKNVSGDLLNYIPQESAEHYRFVPIGFSEGILEVGVLDPENMVALDALQFISTKSGVPYKVFVITKSEFNAIIQNYKGMTPEVDQALSQIDSELEEANKMVIDNKNPQDSLKPGEEEKIVEDAPIIKIVAVILRHAIEGGASDIHIENTGDKVNVRFRVDGTLHTSLVLPLNVFNGVVARIKILSKLRLDEKRKPQDGSFSTKIDGRKIDFRVSTLPTYYGEKVVMRILDSEKGIKQLEELEFSPQNLEMVKEAINRPYGLILITGPTGSGKTTTLYSMLNAVDREKMNVVSLEDPVEYSIPSVNQSQVMSEIGYTFASGLRSILRQDPDVILVGEIRDKETAQLAIQAALTGHLVFSTLHTNSAAGAIPRLIDMGVDPYLIAPTLALSVAQRLVRRTCDSSKKEKEIDESIKEQYNKYFADLPEEYKKNVPLPDKMVDTIPSAECPLGTRGRLGVHEMFKVDRDMQKLIMKAPGEQEIYELARKKGMITMREDGFMKALQGLTPMSEVFTLGDDRE